MVVNAYDYCIDGMVLYSVLELIYLMVNFVFVVVDWVIALNASIWVLYPNYIGWFQSVDKKPKIQLHRYLLHSITKWIKHQLLLKIRCLQITPYKSYLWYIIIYVIDHNCLIIHFHKMRYTSYSSTLQFSLVDPENDL